MVLSTRFYALKPADFEARFLNMPEPPIRSDPGVYRKACHELLNNCIKKCTLSNWMSSSRFSLSVRFESGKGVDPDIERTNSGCFVVSSLFPAPATGLPWWLAGAVDASHEVMLTGPDALRAAVDRIHELKLLEVILANVPFGEMAPHVISFCRFLEDNADRNAWLLALDTDEKLS